MVSSLEAQLSTLQRQHKQLQGKSAQQARDLREATDVGKAARLQQQAVQEDLQALKKQLQGKAAALSRQVQSAKVASCCDHVGHGRCPMWQVHSQHPAACGVLLRQSTTCVLSKVFHEVLGLQHVWLRPAGAHL